MCESYEAEIELAEAAYGNSFQLISKDNFESIFEIEINESIKVRFIIPLEYPLSPLRWYLTGDISNNKREFITQNIQLINNNQDNSIGVLTICQEIQDLLLSNTILQSNKELNKIMTTTKQQQEQQEQQVSIARFLIYFHHIMSIHKKKLIIEYAHDLQLGGYSKPGFPGVVIVEGLLSNVLEYVRRVQRLRWQQMTVRGEEIDIVRSNSDEEVDKNRKCSKQFIQIDGNMSDLAALCRECDLHELFLTSMKMRQT